ncbi:MAG: hypothetical protein MHM6MM_000874 [Cercozoa sp. M6MM]
MFSDRAFDICAPVFVPKYDGVQEAGVEGMQDTESTSEDGEMTVASSIVDMPVNKPVDAPEDGQVDTETTEYWGSFDMTAPEFVFRGPKPRGIGRQRMLQVRRAVACATLPTIVSQQALDLGLVRLGFGLVPKRALAQPISKPAPRPRERKSRPHNNKRHGRHETPIRVDPERTVRYEDLRTAAQPAITATKVKKEGPPPLKKQLCSILNKVTPEMVEVLAPRVVEALVQDSQEPQEQADLLALLCWQRGTLQPSYAAVFAAFVWRVSLLLTEASLKRCSELYKTATCKRVMDFLLKTDEDQSRQVGNGVFAAELARVTLMSTSVLLRMSEWLLLKSNDGCLEVLCNMMWRAGSVLQQRHDLRLRCLFGSLQQVVEKQLCSRRTRFRLLDTLDLYEADFATGDASKLGGIARPQAAAVHVPAVVPQVQPESPIKQKLYQLTRQELESTSLCDSDAFVRSVCKALEVESADKLRTQMLLSLLVVLCELEKAIKNSSSRVSELFEALMRHIAPRPSGEHKRDWIVRGLRRVLVNCTKDFTRAAWLAVRRVEQCEGKFTIEDILATTLPEIGRNYQPAWERAVRQAARKHRLPRRYQG